MKRGFLVGHWAACFLPSSRSKLWLDKLIKTPSFGGAMSKANEWNLIKRQFDELVRDESGPADSIEEIFDSQFRRRFAELITQTARRNSATVYNWPRR